MKTRIASLFAVIAALVAASPVSAVPTKPVDATAVTLLPTDGTPESLRKMVAAFSKRIAEVNASAEAKREQLQKQMKDGLEKAIAKAQSAGDIDTVLALKAAKEQFETLATSNVPLVKNAIDYREKKTAEFETARVSDALKAARDFNDELEKAKKDETTKGNFDTAKALSDYQKKLAAWAQSIRESAPTAQPARPAPTAIQHPQPTEPVLQQTQGGPGETKTVYVSASRPNGGLIGELKAGDRCTIRYLNGTWTAWAGHYPKESPDERFLRQNQHHAAVVDARDPDHNLFALVPSDTASSPFEFTASEDGRFSLRMNDEGSGNFVDNRGTVTYEVKIFRNGSR